MVLNGLTKTVYKVQHKNTAIYRRKNDINPAYSRRQGYLPQHQKKEKTMKALALIPIAIAILEVIKNHLDE